MKLRGEMKDLQVHEYMEMFERFVNLGGVILRNVEILADETMFVFIEASGKKEKIMITDYNSIHNACELCMGYGWV